MSTYVTMIFFIPAISENINFPSSLGLIYVHMFFSIHGRDHLMVGTLGINKTSTIFLIPFRLEIKEELLNS